MLRSILSKVGVGKAPPNWRDFQKELDHHYTAFPVLKPKLPENVARVEALERDGYVVVDDFLSADELSRLTSALEGQMNVIRTQKTRESDSDHNFYHELGRYRILSIDKKVPDAASMFREHPVLMDIVNSYLSNRVRHFDTILEMREPPHDWDKALADLNPHSDHIFREVKAYLALEDITENNGPIVYWTGSHRRGEWRKLPDFVVRLGGVWGESTMLNHVMMDNLINRSPELAEVRQVRCTIKKGSIFIVDTRGVHRASYFPSGERWHLYSAYSMVGYHRGDMPANPNYLQPLDLS